MKKSLYLFGLLFLASAIFTSCGEDKPPVSDMVFGRDAMTLIVGETIRLPLIVLPANANTQNLEWRVDGESIIVENGMATAVSEGLSTRVTVIYRRENLYTLATSMLVDVIAAADGVRIFGTIWATRNVGMPGAFVQNPEDTGMFFQWNRRAGWSSTDPMINSDGGTTWDSSVPTGTIWTREDDPCPAGWRVPSFIELEFLKNLGSTWTTKNGVNGRTFGTTPNQFFLPAAGLRQGTDGALGAVTSGFYWSRSPSDANNAVRLGFNADGINLQENPRNFGFSVRCVAVN